jgi:ubiquinone/menaquinone biosynthesis C-methylase UbiE
MKRGAFSLTYIRNLPFLYITLSSRYNHIKRSSNLDNIKPIILPGTEKQMDNFTAFVHPEGKNILVIGAGTESIAAFFAQNRNNVFVIVDDQENLIRLRFLTAGVKDLSVRMMDFSNTDFRDEKFDVVYAQASVSTLQRNKIVKEIKRILVKDGIFCVGEVVNLGKNIPPFVNNIWENSGLMPLPVEETNSYYAGRGFEILSETDLSETLADYYSRTEDMLKKNKEKLGEDEMVYYKKLLKKIKHESNAYLRLGGKAYMGYKMLILRKV